jgi:O-antigen/teichoic acid export membrane protein
MTAVRQRDEATSETLMALRNAMELGGSLLLTWGIAIGMRLVLPRYLGPSRFGTLTFADAFTGAFFVALGLGVDVYARKHVSVRPGHASDFFGGTLLLRAILTFGLVGTMALVMHLTHRPTQVQVLVYLLALAQFFLNVNATLSAFLHAKGRVGGLSIVAVVAKVVWAAGLLTAIALRADLWAFALAYVLSESIKSTALLVLARRHLGLEVRLDAAATKAMVLASLPYYLGAFATNAYGKLDLALLGVLGTDSEVGWYAAAGAVAGLTLLLAPLIEWALMPTFARAAARSREELYDRVRWATGLILAVAIPASLLVSLGAELWVRFVFGAAFAPASLALRILATTFVLTYVNIIYAITLVMLDRAWTLTLISVGGLIVNVGLNTWLIPHGLALAGHGHGGGGAACALALLGTEVFVSSAMLRVVGRGAFDGPTVRMLAKSLAACAVVVAVDRLLAGLAWARLAIDASTYLAIVLATGALRVRELTKVVAAAVASRAAQRAPAQRG